MSCLFCRLSAVSSRRLSRLAFAFAVVFAAAALANAQGANQEKSSAPAVPKPALKVDPRDWPAWRGPQQNSVSTEKGLVDKWNPKDPWKRSDLGTRSTPIVMHGKLYALVRDKPGTENEGEKVVCVD